MNMKNSLILLLLMIPSCTWWSASNAEAKSGLIVVNVLGSEYAHDCSIKGSINVTMEELDSKAKNWDKNAEIVFYCTNYWCTSSGYAAEQLSKKGYAHVYAYEGGTAEWFQKGYPTTGACSKKYLTRKMKNPGSHDDEIEYTIITAEELYGKMIGYDLIDRKDGLSQEILNVAEQIRRDFAKEEI